MILEFLKTTAIFISIIGVIIIGGVAIVRSIEYIEENTYAVKDTIQKIVYTVMALHVYMLYMGMPLWHALFSMSIQYAFHCFFDVYPVIRPEDPKFIYGVLGSLVNHFLLIRMFINQSSGFVTVVLCFIIIWMTPFCFFFTMSASEDALFVKKTGKGTKTYVGIALEWLWNFGREHVRSRE